MAVRFGTNTPTWLSLGWVIALVILIVDIVFLAVGRIDLIQGLLIGGLALAILL